jgi:hypothetical protein
MRSSSGSTTLKTAFAYVHELSLHVHERCAGVVHLHVRFVPENSCFAVGHVNIVDTFPSDVRHIRGYRVRTRSVHVCRGTLLSQKTSPEIEERVRLAHARLPILF